MAVYLLAVFKCVLVFGLKHAASSASPCNSVKPDVHGAKSQQHTLTLRWQIDGAGTVPVQRRRLRQEVSSLTNHIRDVASHSRWKSLESRAAVTHFELAAVCVCVFVLTVQLSKTTHTHTLSNIIRQQPSCHLFRDPADNYKGVNTSPPQWHHTRPQSNIWLQSSGDESCEHLSAVTSWFQCK